MGTQPVHATKIKPLMSYRPGTLVLILALALTFVSINGGPPSLGAQAGVIPSRFDSPELSDGTSELLSRATTPTSFCKRWSQQSAMVNGTIYLYGGRATYDTAQTYNTWNNDFLTMDMTKTWQISSPSVNGLTQPSGVPSVANGYLWASYGSLYLYGGEYSDKPITSPAPFALWEYNIGLSSWQEHSSPLTSSGVNSPDQSVAVQNAAEGAGFSVASLGRGWYFGGHQDAYTTAGWSVEAPRVYLKSMVEYTFPGCKNINVKSLSNGQTAGSDGVWRNVTGGGSQVQAGFPERADGVLVYIPSFGKEGILLGLAGGTNNTFTQLNVIDVYDIAGSTWYKQGTSGTTPPFRVNACAVVAAAADGSSYNVHMYGGQDLVPPGAQTQYSDMWILSVPSFTWINVDTSTQSTPPGRSGHTCNIWDGQLVVVGGYVGQNLSCDSPGVYVFNLSKLAWVNQFTSLGSVSNGNVQSEQLSQKGNATALAGSYGYQVPALVQSAIGGGPTGGATITVPIATPIGGPLATGLPVTYTVTSSIGASVTGIAGANGASSSSNSSSSSSGGIGGNGGNSSSTSTSSSSSSSNSNSGPNIGAIIAGVIAGLFALVAGYLGFCAYLYRKRLRIHQHHVDQAQRRAREEKGAFSYIASGGSNSGSSKRTRKSDGRMSPGVWDRPDGEKRHSTGAKSEDDLLQGQEPSFVRIMLHPRRSLRVVNT